MLVLTRKAGERIVIGDDIVITILDVRGEGIRIGIDAPNNVKIQREEVLAAVSEANRAASTADDDAEARLRAEFGSVVPGSVASGSVASGSVVPGSVASGSVVSGNGDAGAATAE